MADYDICTFEKFLIEPTLPAFLSTPKQHIACNTFNDFHNIQGEVVQAITDKDPYMSFDIQNFDEKK